MPSFKCQKCIVMVTPAIQEERPRGGSLALSLPELKARIRHRLLGWHYRDLCGAKHYEQIRRVVVLASSSRGGSSVFSEMLRHCEGLTWLQGECNPLFLLSGLTFPDSGSGSEYLDDGFLRAASVSAFRQMLGWEMGTPSRRLRTEEQVERYAMTLWWRLVAQWPRLEFRTAQVRAWMLNAVEGLVRNQHWERGWFTDPGTFYLSFLKEVRREYPEVNPYYYDIPGRLVREAFPEVASPSGPPGDWCVEEPPFILAVPWTPMDEETQVSRSLVLKAPSNAHRLESLRVLFPNAQIWILHLTRNAAASINGLIDGWCHHGFFSYRLSDLGIPGYSDVYESWGRAWWKFDLPPGWRSLTHLPLEEVCAEQWCRAHQAIIGYVKRHSPPYLQVRFEDVLSNPMGRRTTFDRVADWLGVQRPSGAIETLPPPTMATKAPAPRRWLARADKLERVLTRPEVIETMCSLTYGSDRHEWM